MKTIILKGTGGGGCVGVGYGSVGARTTKKTGRRLCGIAFIFVIAAICFFFTTETLAGQSVRSEKHFLVKRMNIIQ